MTILTRYSFAENLSFLTLCGGICSEPYVTEEELKLMLRGAILSGAIEEEEQVRSSMNLPM